MLAWGRNPAYIASMERSPPIFQLPLPHAEKHAADAAQPVPEPSPTPAKPRPDPTRYGDWEMNGRCIDF